MKRFIVLFVSLGLVLQSYCQPILVKNIHPSAGSTFPQLTYNIVELNGSLYFAASDESNELRLWKSDGTAAGTVALTTGASGIGVSSIINANGTLFFTASNPASGKELWKSDGTAAGTIMVKDIWPGTNGGCTTTSVMTNIGSVVYFAATDGANGYELWKSDGTTAGTTLVKDIRPSGSAFSLGYSMMAIGSKVFFSADNGATNGIALFVSDGTSANTVLVKDINTVNNIDIGVPGAFTNLNGKLLFAGNDGTNGTEPWISDGTSAGTQLLLNIDGGTGSSIAASKGFTAMGNYGYFSAQENTYGVELWRTDGTTAGTVLVKDIWPGNSGHGTPNNITAINSVLYFAAKTVGGLGVELWKSTGAIGNAEQITDINSGSGDSNPVNFTLNSNGKIYFTADDGSHGDELWETNGTDAGTKMVYDIDLSPTGSNPSKLTSLNGKLYFAADDGNNGLELWSYNPAVALPLPGTVNDLAASVVSGTSIKLSWSDVTNETLYEIERAEEGGSYIVVATIGADLSSYTVTALTAGVNYSFRIRQKNAAGYSAYSNEAIKTIPVISPPDMSLILISPTSIKVKWQLIPQVNQYYVERSIGNNTSYSQVATGGGDVSDANVVGLTAGTTYYFRMRSSMFIDGQTIFSPYSGEQSITIPVAPPPPGPANFNASIIGNTVTLTWTDATGELHYLLERSETGGDPFNLVTNPLPANTTTYNDTDIEPGKKYYYRLAYAMPPDGSVLSFYSHYSSYPTAVTIPVTPANVVATVTGDNKITLSWNDVSTESNYIIEWGTNSQGPFTTINPVTLNTTSRDFTGLIAGVTYYFKIAAYNATGTSPYSTLKSATIPSLIVSASLNAFSTNAGTPSASQQFIVSGNGLSSNVTINAPTSFEVSLSSSSGYSSSLNLSPSGGAINNKAIYARYNPATPGTHTGNISVSTSGVSTKTIPVSGNSTVLVSAINVSGANNETTISQYQGTLQMSAEVLPANATNKTFQWSVTNGTGTATISNAGLLTATGNGTVTVKATANDASGVIGTKVITLSGQTPAVLISSILVSGNDISVKDGTSQMNTTILPANASNKAVTWSVTNGTGMASITSDGLLAGFTNGTVTVKAAAKDGSGVIGTKVITLSGQDPFVPISSIVVSGNDISVKDGTSQMGTTILPANASNKLITWSVANGTGMATIDSGGLLTAVTNGTVTVKATAQDGSGVSGTKLITLSGQNPIVLVSSINVNGNNIAVASGTSQMSTTILPANASIKTVTWSVMNGTGKATIDGNGLLTAVADGIITVTAEATDGSGVTGTKNITITGQNSVVPVKSIQITGVPSHTSVSFQLNANVLPENATIKTVKWSLISEAGIATINSSGFVTTTGYGTITIVAESQDASGVKSSKTMCVFPPVPTITSDLSNLEKPVLTSSSNTGNQWYWNGEVIKNAVLNMLTVDHAGTYSVEATIGGCASGQSDKKEFLITGLPEYFTFSLYPNPAHEEIILSVPGSGKIQWQIMNMSGQKMKSMNGEVLDEIKINIGDLPAGPYLLEVSLNGNQKNIRFVRR